VDLLGMELSISRTLQSKKNVQPEDRITFGELKTKSSMRLISLSPANVCILRDHKAKQNEIRKAIGWPDLSDDDLVFCHWDGKPLRPDSVSHIWIKLTRRFGFEGVRLHDLRHSMASLMLAQGTPAKIVQERLGYASVTTTLNIYAHVLPGMQASAVSRLDDLLPKEETKLEKDLKELV
jgi:integrase